MYPNPNQSSPQGAWNPNAPPTSQAPQWSPQPPNGQYAPAQNQNRNQQIPPITQAVAQGSPIQTLQPQHPDHYRALPAPPQMYATQYPHQQMQYPQPQPAPRQRTAIACRYCRRRKIRCSGFDQSEDGRCTNCQRFSQECVFTPVSSQAQAFVPAHTVWRGQNPPANAQLYGAYGQPLPQQGNRDPYPPPQQSPGQYPPPPQGYQQQVMYPQPPPQGGAGQKRSSDEPHTPTLPPPNPGAQAQVPRDGQQYSYPDPTGLTAAGASPASSTASFHSAPPHAQPYYAQPAPHVSRASPQSAYPYDASRSSSSPRTFGQSGTPAPSSVNGLQPSMPIRTPTPGSAQAHAQRHGVQIKELVGPGGQSQQQQQTGQANVKLEERTSTDTKHSDPTTDGTTAPDGSLAKKDEPTPKRNGVVDAGVQTDVSGPLVKEQVS